MTLLKLFYFMNFSLCKFKKRSTWKLRLSQISRFDSQGWHQNFWVSNKILLGLLIFLLKVTFFCVNSKTENNPNLLVQTLLCQSLTARLSQYSIRYQPCTMTGMGGGWDLLQCSASIQTNLNNRPSLAHYISLLFVVRTMYFISYTCYHHANDHMQKVCHLGTVIYCKTN